MENTFQKRIKESVDNICEKHNLSQPITVPSAGKMIAEYDGLEKAIELFEGAVLQYHFDPFRSSAYKATLITLLLPMKEKNK